MDCSPPGSSVHRISQARILEWVAFPSPSLDIGLIKMFILVFHKWYEWTSLPVQAQCKSPVFSSLSLTFGDPCTYMGPREHPGHWSHDPAAYRFPDLRRIQHLVQLPTRAGVFSATLLSHGLQKHAENNSSAWESITFLGSAFHYG